MKRICLMLSAVWIATWIVLTAKVEAEGSELLLDVYSVKVASDVTQEKLFTLWAKALKEGGSASKQYEPVIHAVYRLGGVVSIDKRYKTGEGNEEQICVVGRLEPVKESGSYRVDFSELGRPPAYQGKTALTIEPTQKRVLVLPVVELDAGEKLETVVTLQYRLEGKENGLKSRFEI